MKIIFKIIILLLILNATYLKCDQVVKIYPPWIDDTFELKLKTQPVYLQEEYEDAYSNEYYCSIFRGAYNSNGPLFSQTFSSGTFSSGIYKKNIVAFGNDDEKIFAGTDDGKVYLKENPSLRWEVALDFNDNSVKVNQIFCDDNFVGVATQSNGFHYSTNGGETWSSILTSRSILSLSGTSSKLYLLLDNNEYCYIDFSTLPNVSSFESSPLDGTDIKIISYIEKNNNTVLIVGNDKELKYSWNGTQWKPLKKYLNFTFGKYYTFYNYGNDAYLFIAMENSNEYEIIPFDTYLEPESSSRSSVGHSDDRIGGFHTENYVLLILLKKSSLTDHANVIQRRLVTNNWVEDGKYFVPKSLNRSNKSQFCFTNFKNNLLIGTDNKKIIESYQNPLEMIEYEPLLEELGITKTNFTDFNCHGFAMYLNNGGTLEMKYGGLDYYIDASLGDIKKSALLDPNGITNENTSDTFEHMIDDNYYIEVLPEDSSRYQMNSNTLTSISNPIETVSLPTENFDLVTYHQNDEIDKESNHSAIKSPIQNSSTIKFLSKTNVSNIPFIEHNINEIFAFDKKRFVRFWSSTMTISNNHTPYVDLYNSPDSKTFSMGRNIISSKDIDDNLKIKYRVAPWRNHGIFLKEGFHSKPNGNNQFLAVVEGRSLTDDRTIMNCKIALPRRDDTLFVNENDDLIKIIPNPVRTTALVKYSIIEKTKASIAIINSLGEKIIQISNNKMIEPGTYDFNLSAQNLSPGTYFVVIESIENIISEKFMIVK